LNRCPRRGGRCHDHPGGPAAIRPGGAAQAANGDGTFKRDHLRALAQRVDVNGLEIRITGSKSALLRALAASSSAGSEVLSFVSKWRAVVDENENYVFTVTL
jgi:hypothetical protein